MQKVLQAINNSGFTPLEQGEVVLPSQSEVNLSAVNPVNLIVKVESGAVANLLMLHGDDADASILIQLGRGARLNLTQIAVGVGSVNVNVNHGEEALSKIVTVSLNHNVVNLNLQLCGVRAFSEVDTLQLGTEKDNNVLKLNMRHLSPDSSSRSLSKCVASGEADLHFDGVVYVSHDAQRTDAQQNCRSIELSDTAHIVAQPQLEIYADDVKCSHGATVGQMNNESIYYMRQRGLSEEQARKLQLDGFVSEVTLRCEIEQVRDTLVELVRDQLDRL